MKKIQVGRVDERRGREKGVKVNILIKAIEIKIPILFLPSERKGALGLRLFLSSTVESVIRSSTIFRAAKPREGDQSA